MQTQRRGWGDRIEAERGTSQSQFVDALNEIVTANVGTATALMFWKLQGFELDCLQDIGESVRLGRIVRWIE
ncbi:hypothetical protein ACHAWF_006714 [Thalassiosira exigua]